MKAGDIDANLNVLFENNKEFIVEFLKENQLSSTGTKDELKAEVRNQISAGKINPKDIVAFVNKIEGWGNQRIYLYKIHHSINTLWKDEGEVVKTLKKTVAQGF